MYMMYYFYNDKLYTKKIDDLSEANGYNVYCIKDEMGVIVVDYRANFI